MYMAHCIYVLSTEWYFTVIRNIIGSDVFCSLMSGFNWKLRLVSVAVENVTLWLMLLILIMG